MKLQFIVRHNIKGVSHISLFFIIAFQGGKLQKELVILLARDKVVPSNSKYINVVSPATMLHREESSALIITLKQVCVYTLQYMSYLMYIIINMTYNTQLCSLQKIFNEK